MAGKNNQFGEVGVGGTAIANGVPANDFVPALRGPAKWRAYDEMRSNDAVISAILFAIEMIAKQSAMSIVPETEDTAAIDIAEFVESCLHDMSASWPDVLGEVMSFIPFGFAVHEKVFKRRVGPAERDGAKRSKYSDGRIGWRKLPGRLQKTISKWIMDDDGGVAGVVQTDPNAGAEYTIPIEKMLLFRTTITGSNPAPDGILRKVYRAWYFKKNIETYEAIGIERDLAGVPVVRVPSEILLAKSSGAQRAKAVYESIARDLKANQNAGVLIPSDLYPSTSVRQYEVELMNPGGKRLYDTSAIINRWNTQIAQSVLADFIMLGTGGAGGSYSLGETKGALFLMAIKSFLDNVAAVFTSHAFPQLLELNGMDVRLSPRMKFAPLEDIDPEKLSKALQQLSVAGMDFTDRPTQEEVRSLIGLPPVPDDFEETQLQVGEDMDRDMDDDPGDGEV